MCGRSALHLSDSGHSCLISYFQPDLYRIRTPLLHHIQLSLMDLHHFLHTFQSDAAALSISRILLHGICERNSDPSLIRQLKGGEALSGKELGDFLDRLAADYGEVLSGERDVLFKLKELWFYLGRLFPEGGTERKKIRKAQSLSEYRAAVRNLLRMLG